MSRSRSHRKKSSGGGDAAPRAAAPSGAPGFAYVIAHLRGIEAQLSASAKDLDDLGFRAEAGKVSLCRGEVTQAIFVLEDHAITWAKKTAKIAPLPVAVATSPASPKKNKGGRPRKHPLPPAKAAIDAAAAVEAVMRGAGFPADDDGPNLDDVLPNGGAS